MGATLGSYEIARSGLNVNERSLFVTGHNLSNANVKGYTRQHAVIETYRYTNENYKYQIGLGASIQETRQIRHMFMDNIYRTENTKLGYWDVRNKTLTDVQAILGDPMGEGLQKVMNEFWNSWQELCKDPSNLTYRAMVRQRGEAFVNRVNHIGQQLSKLQMDLNKQFSDGIDEVNKLTEQIAKLNMDIASNEITGDNANDLRDQRNLLVDQLSKLVDIDVTEMQDKQLYITVGGYAVVYKGTSRNLYAGSSTDEPLFFVPKVEGADAEVILRSGSLKGIMSVRGNEFEVHGVTGGHSTPFTPTENISISHVKEMLNDLVHNIADQVNKEHMTGYTLGSSPVNNIRFFDGQLVSPGVYDYSIGYIKINPQLEDLHYIAAGKLPGASGDNEVALNIADLRNTPCLNNIVGMLSPDEFYRATIMSLGNNGSEALTMSGNQQNLVQAADANRQAIAGVSMDEEMSNMMKFQYAYGAATKVLNTIDEMIETVVNRMGLVGR